MSEDAGEFPSLDRAVCAACGEAIDTTEWHLTATSEGDAGRPRVHLFCDEDCREAWNPSDPAV